MVSAVLRPLLPAVPTDPHVAGAPDAETSGRCPGAGSEGGGVQGRSHVVVLVLWST